MATHYEKVQQLLPSDIDRNAFIAACMMEANCLADDVEPISVLKSCLRAAVIGLIPGMGEGLCHIVPFKKQAQLIVGYKGFKELAFQSGYLSSLYMDVVCSDDQFEHWIDTHGPQIKHVPNLDRRPSKDNIVASYCVWATSRGGNGVMVVPRSDIDKVDKGRDVWRSDFAAMARKTAIIRAAKVWPTHRRMALAVMSQEQLDRNEQQQIPGDDIVDAEVTEPGKSFDDLAGEEA